MSPHHSDQMSQRSQVSRVKEEEEEVYKLGLCATLLCSVVKTLIVRGVRQRDRPSKGQGRGQGCGQLKKTEKVREKKLNKFFWSEHVPSSL